MEVKLTTLPGHSDREVCVLARDLSKDKNEKAIIERMRYEYDHLLYRMSHDLRAPMTTLKGLINLSMQDHKCTPTQKEYLELMTVTINRQNALMEKIHDLSALHSAIIKPENVETEQLIRVLIEQTKYKRDYEVDWNLICDTECEIKTDRYLFRAMLLPIIENAIQYKETERTSKVKIVLTKMLGMTILNIEDNGAGMIDEVKPHIFDMFFRGSESSSGSGLGLYLSRLAADKLNARISVQSELGRGTSFNITIPNMI